MKDKITKERLEKEFSITQKALEKARVLSQEDPYRYKAARECLDIAISYCSDAEHFKEKGDFASAFGALNYAFGIIDAGVKLGVFSDHGLY